MHANISPMADASETIYRRGAAAQVLGIRQPVQEDEAPKEDVKFVLVYCGC